MQLYFVFHFFCEFCGGIFQMCLKINIVFTQILKLSINFSILLLL